VRIRSGEVGERFYTYSYKLLFFRAGAPFAPWCPFFFFCLPSRCFAKGQISVSTTRLVINIPLFSSFSFEKPVGKKGRGGSEKSRVNVRRDNTPLCSPPFLLSSVNSRHKVEPFPKHQSRKCLSQWLFSFLFIFIYFFIYFFRPGVKLGAGIFFFPALGRVGWFKRAFYPKPFLGVVVLGNKKENVIPNENFPAAFLFVSFFFFCRFS